MDKNKINEIKSNIKTRTSPYILIVGSIEQAVIFCRRLGVSYSDKNLIVITSLNDLRGMTIREWDIIRVGTYYNLKEIGEIEDYIRLYCVKE